MVLNKHQQRTDATRKKLIAAARRVFARDGFEAARIEEIAAEAGHTRGAFYAHFDTKEDLFFALLEQQAAERINELRVELEKKSTVEDRTAVLRNFYLSRARERDSVLLMVEFKLFALRHPNLHKRLAEAHRRIRASFSYDAIAKLMPWHNTGDDHEMQKVLLEVVLAGLVLETAYDPKRVSAAETSEMLGQVFDWMTAGRTRPVGRA